MYQDRGLTPIRLGITNKGKVVYGGHPNTFHVLPVKTFSEGYKSRKTSFDLAILMMLQYRNTKGIFKNAKCLYLTLGVLVTHQHS